MLSVALIVFALARPVPRISTPAPAIDRAALEADFSKRLNDAVEKAVAVNEARQASQTMELLAKYERRNELERQAMIVRVAEYLDVEKKRLNTRILASNGDISGASQ
jgi:hypothetical protein